MRFLTLIFMLCALPAYAAQLPPDEFPMLTENAERLANHAQDPPSGTLNPALAAAYAAAAVEQLNVEIAQVPRRRD